MESLEVGAANPSLRVTGDATPAKCQKIVRA
jgi:hypothetical protein